MWKALREVLWEVGNKARKGGTSETRSQTGKEYEMWFTDHDQLTEVRGEQACLTALRVSLCACLTVCTL